MNSISRRIYITVLVVVALVILLFSVLISQFLARFFIGDKQENLLSTAAYVNSVLKQAVREELSASELSRSVNDIGETANARIVILDFSAVPNPDRDAIQATLGIHDEELITGIEQILAGRTVLRKRQYDRSLGVHVVVVGVPARINDQIIGAIILLAPVYQTDIAVAHVRRMIIWVALAAFFFALLAVLWTTGTIIRPIRDVSLAATRIAARLPVDDLQVPKADELAMLVRSFNEMKNKVSALEKMRADLLAGVSHDLRTPLTAMRGFIQGMLDGVIPAAHQKQYLQQTLTEIQRLTGLVNQLLDTARLESGSLTLYKTATDITELLHEAIRFFTPAAQAAGITLHINIQSSVIIFADAGRLRQVFWNIFSNAIHYNKVGGRVTVTAREIDGEVLVAISDTGIGIKAKDLPFITDKFYRIDTTENRDRGGSGLGLYIASEIIKQHGGRLLIASTEGEGTTITCVLPF